MIATRLAFLAMAAALLLAALGATAADLQPSGRLVLVTATIGLIAPLFWPGSSATPARTALRVGIWSLAVMLIAAAAVVITGGSGRPFTRTASACAVLLLILLLTHAVAAHVEQGVRTRTGGSGGARELAGHAVTVVLAILGSVPLWLGPAAELLADRHEWVIDAVVGVSPLTHLAVASDNDLLRNQWFYQHSNLAALRYSYPGLATLTTAYIALCLALLLAPLAAPGRRRKSSRAAAAHSTSEHVT